MLRHTSLPRTANDREADSGDQSWLNCPEKEISDSQAYLYNTDAYLEDRVAIKDAQEHLILYHGDCGDLYYSKLPDTNLQSDLLAEREFSDGDLQIETPAAVQIMATPSFLRWFLTVLHAVTCLVSAVCFAFSVFGTLFSDQCLPRLINKDGSPIESQPDFAVLCDTVLFGLGVIFIISILMCGLVQCSLSRPPMVVLSFFLTSCMGAFAVFGGTTFTVHNALWCDSLSQNLLPKHVKCSDAAAEFDRVNKREDMRSFETQMEVQQITCWTLFPLTFMTALAYAIALRWSGREPSASGEYRNSSPPRGFYQYLATGVGADRDFRQSEQDQCDERSPLTFS